MAHASTADPERDAADWHFALVGGLVATGHLADEPDTGSRLRFRIGGLDELALDGWVAACTDAVIRYGLPAA